MIKVLLADDSNLMRLLLASMLREQPDIEMLDTAADGKELFEKAQMLRPDVILTDLMMEPYDGSFAIDKITTSLQIPIIVVSSVDKLTNETALATMDKGVVAFINKPSVKINANLRDILPQLLDAIRQASGGKTKHIPTKGSAIHALHSFSSFLPYQIVVIGASTGGTSAIETILRKLPANFPLPIVIAQHIRHEFIYSYANRLNESLPFNVSVAHEKQYIENGKIYLLPANCNMKIEGSLQNPIFKITQEIYSSYNHPSVDALFESASSIFEEKLIGILLTGMGKDGANGLLAIKEKGGYTIAQDEKTCVVFGMPKAAYDLGAVKVLLPIHDISQYLVGLLDS